MLVGNTAFNVNDIKDWLFFNIDECLVPFRLKAIRELGEKVLLFTCTSIVDVEQAKEFIGLDIFIPLLQRPSGMKEVESFIACRVFDVEKEKILGTVSNFIESDFNPLIEIKTENATSILLPFNEEFILSFENEELKVRLPNGLTEL